jgi:hypothetical protein
MKKSFKKIEKQVQSGFEEIETDFITNLGPRLKKMKAALGEAFPAYCRSAGIPDTLVELAIEYVDTVHRAAEADNVDIILKSNLRAKLADFCMKAAGDAEGVGADAALHLGLPTN